MTRHFERISITLEQGLKDQVLAKGFNVSAVCNIALKKVLLEQTHAETVAIK